MKEARIAESDALKVAELATVAEQERVKAARVEYESVQRELMAAERKMKDLAATLTGAR